MQSDLQRCAYGSHCSWLGGVYTGWTGGVDLVVANPHATRPAELRLILSRNFPGRHGAGRAGQMYAEVTGFSALLRDQASGEPTGVRMQVSKKWQSATYRQNYEAGYGGATTWGTVNVFLRLPPKSYWAGGFFFGE